MPYVITTTTRTHRCTNPAHEHVTCHAVATLEEAQRLVDNRREQDALNARPWPVSVRGLHEAITETGGTIGPLPDGAVIEVTQDTYQDIAAFCGHPMARYEMPDPSRPVGEHIIDAYNASQGTS